MAKRERKAISVKWKLFAFLMLFVAFMLGVIWLLQILMLGRFYRDAKYQELENIAEVIEQCLETESLDAAVYSCAVDYSTCIRIFKKVGDNAFVEAASADVVEKCAIHNISQEALRNYYDKTLAGDGFYAETKEASSQMGMFWSENSQEGRPHRIDLSGEDKVTGMIYNRLILSESGTVYMLMLNAELTPVSATVDTLKTQFVWISIVLTTGALVLALIISNKISRPISDVNRAAKELAAGNYNVHFEGAGYREIGELSDTLNYAAAELSKVEVLQQELIANVSHDLRTPLTLIGGYAEMMSDLPSENTPENMQVIMEETARLSELVTDLLDISGLRAGTRELNREVFDLTETVREVMARYEKLVSAENYEISFLADGACLVRADRRMILQVIYNLINNAIHYVGEDRAVIVTQVQQGDRVRMIVTDHGCGIPAEELPLIWDRYYRANAAHKRATVGSGLGLSIVKRILEAHGASFGVESEPGVGSSFWFELSMEENEGANQ